MSSAYPSEVDESAAPPFWSLGLESIIDICSLSNSSESCLGGTKSLWDLRTCNRKRSDITVKNENKWGHRRGRETKWLKYNLQDSSSCLSIETQNSTRWMKRFSRKVLWSTKMGILQELDTLLQSKPNNVRNFSPRINSEKYNYRCDDQNQQNA